MEKRSRRKAIKKPKRNVFYFADMLKDKKWASISLLFLIVVAALAIRIYRLEDVPPGFFPDEVIHSYNAYSISKIFRDAENNFPVIITAWDNHYILSFYIYTMALLMRVLGPSVFSARLTSVVYGIGAIILTYLVVKKLFKEERLALFSAFFVSFSPWYFIMNRAAWEYSATPFYLLLGLYFFLASLERGGVRGIVFSGLSFALCARLNQVSMLLTLLFIVILFLVYRKDVSKKKGGYLLGLLIYFAVAIAPLVYYCLSEGSSILFERVDSTLIFGKTYTIDNTVKLMDQSWYLSFLPKTSLFIYLIAIARTYVGHISPSYLFFDGSPNKALSAPGYGVLYDFELPLVFIGVCWCLKNIKRPESKLILLWLLIFSLPGDFSDYGYGEAPHPNRTVGGIPLFGVLSAIGVFYLLSLLESMPSARSRTTLRVLFTVFSVYCTYTMYGFFAYYFVEYPKQTLDAEIATGFWHTNVGKALSFTESLNKSRYDAFILTDKCCYFPHYYLAFFTKYPPIDFINWMKTWPSMGKYAYDNIFTYCKTHPGDSDVVYIAKENDGITLDELYRMYVPKGDVSFIIGVNCTPYKKFVKEWMTCGLFPSVNDSGFDMDYINESRGFVEDDCAGKRWMKLHNSDFYEVEELAYLSRYYNYTSPAVAYTHTYVYSPANQDLQLRYGSDDGIKIWVNGRLVASNMARRAAEVDNDIIDVNLKQGWNTLLVKSENFVGGWGFYLRFSTADGKDPDGLNYSIRT